MKWFGRNSGPDRVDPEASIKQAEETKRRVQANWPYVNRVSSYFENREGRNGFGEDVEMTWRPRTQGN
jgi:hypothetical protein